MLKIFKNLFSKPPQEEKQEGEPQEIQLGRTFNKILTGKYFGLDDRNADKELVDELKDKKIEQIKKLELKPKFARYLYAQGIHDYTTETPVAVHVAFQKERYSRKRQMVHVSEMSFIVKADEFKELEEKLDISIVDDFIHLEPEEAFKGKERRKEQRSL